MSNTPLTGGCLCGAVRFKLSPPLRHVIVCHCRQCAQWTGYAAAATAVAPHNFQLVSGGDALKWYASSDHAERGFCGVCGSSLLWRPRDGSRMSVLAGTLDPPTGLTISAHIFVGSKSDYDEIADNVPHYEGSAGDQSDVSSALPSAVLPPEVSIRARTK